MVVTAARFQRPIGERPTAVRCTCLGSPPRFRFGRSTSPRARVTSPLRICLPYSPGSRIAAADAATPHY